MNKLQELQRSGFNISPITKKAINKNGLGKITFKSASMKYPDSLEIHFLVESSDGKGNEKHTTNNGQFLSILGGYKITIQCTNFGNIAPPNFLSLPLSQQIIYIEDIISKSDLKFDCSCAAFYWQGNSELLDRKPPEANFSGFAGQPGKGIWDSKHNTSNRICKHIYHVLDNIDSYITKILKDLNKNTSVSSSTTQNTSLQAPVKPAGTPVVQPSSDLNSEGIKTTTDKIEKETKADTLDLPQMDTTDVKAKSHEKESDAITGAEKIEPPIEDISLKKDPEEEELEKELPNVLTEQLLRELKVRSKEDYEIFKKYYNSGAYLFVTFENFKKELEKELEREKLKSFKEIYEECNVKTLFKEMAKLIH